MIEKTIPGNKMKFNFIKQVYENEGINVTSIIKKLKSSPNSVLEYANLLEDREILIKSKQGRKKPAVRNLKINFNSELACLFIGLIEADKREEITRKYTKFKNLIKQFNFSEVFVLLYGSYARKSADNESDIDMVFVGDNVEKNKIKELLVTFPDASVKIDSTADFIKNSKKPLYQNILKEHVVLFNEILFIKTLAKIKRGDD